MSCSDSFCLTLNLEIMSGLPYSSMRSGLQQMPLQYGVGSSSPSDAVSQLGYLAGFMPGIGSVLGAGLNLLGVGLQNRQNERYYEEYASPVAQMSQMKQAGINSNAAAQGIAGANAQTPTAASMNDGVGIASNIAELLGGSVNSMLQAKNLQSQTDNVDAQTAATKLQTRFDSDSYSDRLAYLENLGLISHEQYVQAAEYSSKYPEILSQGLEETKSRIRSNDAQVKVLDQQEKNLKEEVSKIKEEIRKLKSDELVNESIIGVNRATENLRYQEAYLREKEQELSGIQVKKAQLGADSNVELKYREIEANDGTEAANKWLEGVYELYNVVNRASEDAKPLTQEQRSIIARHDEIIERCQSEVDYYREKYDNVGSLRKDWIRGNLEAAESRLKKAQEAKYEELRRLGLNVSKSASVAGTLSVSQSK